jgi:hypothetical protein
MFTLPLLVRCQAAAVLTRRDSPLPLNLAHPLLLYSQRTVRKLLARNVLLDPRTRRYAETDENIVVPSTTPVSCLYFLFLIIYISQGVTEGERLWSDYSRTWFM